MTVNFERLRASMQEYVNCKKVAGMVIEVARKEKAIYRESLGMMDVRTSTPMRMDTIFRIASMTKPITAVAVLMLVDEGHVRLEDPIAAFIPEFKESLVATGWVDAHMQVSEPARDITLLDLLTHTSGMCLGVARTDPVEALWTDAVHTLIQTPGMTLQAAVRELAGLPLASQPGTVWRYSQSFEVLAALVEIVSGEWFDQFLRKRIFEPLAMADTGYVVDPKKTPRLAALYRFESDEPLALTESAVESAHVLMHNYQSGTGWTTGGDMLVSTCADYRRFLQMLVSGGSLENQRVLKPETAKRLCSNQLGEDVLLRGGFEHGYGQGLSVHVVTDPNKVDGLGSFGEISGAGGHGTYFWCDLNRELVACLMLQLSSCPYPIHQEFRAELLKALSP